MKKRILTLLFTLTITFACLCSLIGCSEAEMVILNKTEITIYENNVDYLEASIFPEDVANKNITWSSLNESVAVVKNGVVTAISEGETEIRATSANGEYESCKVTVVCPLNFVSNDNGFTISACAKDVKTVVVPSKHKGKNVTEISLGAFSDCETLETITLPFIGASINSVNNTHFGYIFGANNSSHNGSYVPTSLKQVNVTGGTIVNYNAFYDCNSIKSITLPNGITSIESYAFSSCESLESVVLPDSVNIIKEYAFEDCEALKYNEKSGLSYLGNERNPYLYLAKTSSQNLTTAIVDGECKIIGNNAFSNCTTLTNVTIPNSVKSIGINALTGCNSLQKLSIPYIGEKPNNAQYAYFGFLFGGVSYLDNKNSVPQTLKQVIVTSATIVEENAFANCSSLTEITIDGSISYIGIGAFANCNSIEYLSLPFVGASEQETTKVHFGYVFGAQDYNQNNVFVPQSLKRVKIANATKIGTRAFYGCEYLINIELPNRLTSIGEEVFTGCYSLQYNEKNMLNYLGSSDNPYLYLVELASINKSTAVIESGCKIIGSGAFLDRETLISVSIPNGIIDIGEKAFYNCTSLEYLTIPDNITSLNDLTFYNCTSLRRVVMPSSLTDIGASVFYNCSSLETIAIPSSVTSIGENAFYNCSSLQYNVENGLEYLGNDNNKFLYLNNVATKESTVLSVNNNCKIISNYAFVGCDKLEEINLPFIGAKVNDVENGHFGYIFDAKTYRENAEKVPASLKTVVIKSAPNIFDNAFYGCKNISSITLPNDLKTVGSYAFYNCDSLTNMLMPESLTHIGRYAFAECDSFKSITFDGNGNWGITKNYEDWKNRKNAEESVSEFWTTPKQFASKLKSTCVDYYWYKK